MHTIYKDYLLDHYRYPRNAGDLPDSNCSSIQENQACGDHVSMVARIEEAGIMQEVRFNARGCVICVAGASLLSDQIKGESIDAIVHFDTQKMVALLGIPLGPTRLKCALLSLYAIQDGIKKYTQKAVDQ